MAKKYGFVSDPRLVFADMSSRNSREGSNVVVILHRLARAGQTLVYPSNSTDEPRLDWMLICHSRADLSARQLRGPTPSDTARNRMLSKYFSDFRFISLLCVDRRQSDDHYLRPTWDNVAPRLAAFASHAFLTVTHLQCYSPAALNAGYPFLHLFLNWPYAVY